MPALFIGHGSPENAIEKNVFSRGWAKTAARLPVPKAVLSISAHWVTEATEMTGMAKPRTIHDFYGFPEALYAVRYPAPGAPALAREIQCLLGKTPSRIDMGWGLDHGTWSVLVNMYPKADIPVVQLSLNSMLSPEEYYAVGRALAPLRDNGILILGSGNVVHNLRQIDFSAPPFEWALAFDAWVKKGLNARTDKDILDYKRQPLTPLAHPTDEHFLPLLYVLGASAGEKPRYFNESLFAASLSMRCALFDGV